MEAFTWDSSKYEYKLLNKSKCCAFLNKYADLGNQIVSETENYEDIIKNYKIWTNTKDTNIKKLSKVKYRKIPDLYIVDGDTERFLNYLYSIGCIIYVYQNTKEIIPYKTSIKRYTKSEVEAGTKVSAKSILLPKLQSVFSQDTIRIESGSPNSNYITIEIRPEKELTRQQSLNKVEKIVDLIQSIQYTSLAKIAIAKGAIILKTLKDDININNSKSISVASIQPTLLNIKQIDKGLELIFKVSSDNNNFLQELLVNFNAYKGKDINIKVSKGSFNNEDSIKINIQGV